MTAEEIEEMQKLEKDAVITIDGDNGSGLVRFLVNNRKELLELALIGITHKARMEKLEEQLKS